MNMEHKLSLYSSMGAARSQEATIHGDTSTCTTHVVGLVLVSAPE